MGYARKVNDKFYSEVSKFSTDSDLVRVGGEEVSLRAATTPVSSLLNFQKALSKKMHGVQFYSLGRRECYVYYPHEKYARGKIWTVEGYYDVPTEFYVESRTISNGRYASNNSDHKVQHSNNLNTAAKKAAAALIPWSIHELAAVHARPYEDGRDEQLNGIENSLREAFAKLGIGGKRSPAYAALKSMVHQITDLDIKSKVEAITGYLEDEASLQSVGGTPMFVYIGQDHHGQRQLDTLRLDSVSLYAIESTHNLVRYYERSPQEGYEDIVGKISVLNMATVGDYISGVGMKADEDMFYVC